MIYDYMILGGGSAGCTLASRLSEIKDRTVLLVEAGKDFAPGSEPADILSSYPMGAAFNPEYHWHALRVRHAALGGNTPGRTPPRFMEQARVMGGGSSINAQMANRGSPEDYAEWEELGAKGWDWEGVLPYFKKLETDIDFDGELHGKEGPIIIRRVKEAEWSAFSFAVAEALENAGLQRLDDQNGDFVDGWFPVSISNHPDDRRHSASIGYLSANVRTRKNLKILSETFVDKVLFTGKKASGAVLKRGSEAEEISAREIIVSAGALHTPAILMRSGIGRGAHLNEKGIEVVHNLPAVGLNLNEHPTIAVSAYLRQEARIHEIAKRHVHIGFRFSSGLEGCGPNDMYTSVTAKSAWHPVGTRLGSMLMWCNKPYSRGFVELSASDPNIEPIVNFDMLSDRRDLLRMMDGVRRMAGLFDDPILGRVALDAFPSCYSERVRKIGAVNAKNKILTSILAAMMDGPSVVRRSAIHRFISLGVTMDKLLADEEVLEEWIRDGVSGCWHPSGTCRMGQEGDPAAVTDPEGRVHGVEGLRVCDASLFPCVPRANTNIPTIMCAEKISDAIKEQS
jgi:5-(hydroxymethyl)furfural/furfural oxidase